MKFKIIYKAELGQSISVLGNCSKLGNWRQVSAHPLQCSDGEIWESVNNLNTDSSFFLYKYVVVFNNQIYKFEEGMDRIADLELLDSN